MSGGWPSSIDPVQLAENGARLTGELALTAMPRLLKACPQSSGAVNIDLRFERNDPDGMRVMRGTVRASVRAMCQRCLEPMALDLDVQPRLILLRPGERDGLDHDDALVVERPVSLSALVEDELLLAMPMIPMHPPAACAAKVEVRENPARAHEQRRPSRFAALDRLKHKDR